MTNNEPTDTTINPALFSPHYHQSALDFAIHLLAWSGHGNKLAHQNAWDLWDLRGNRISNSKGSPSGHRENMKLRTDIMEGQDEILELSARSCSYYVAAARLSGD